MQNLEQSFLCIREQLSDTLLASQLNSDIFDSVFCAVTAKSIDFNIRVQNASDDDGIIIQPFLRGITEDLISISFFDQLDANDRKNLICNIQTKDFFTAIDKQRKFFNKYRPWQLVYPAHAHGLDDATLNKNLKYSKCRLKKNWENLGLGKNGPNVRDMAECVNMLDIYDYLYAATSRTVHFNPHSLLRLGWAEISGSDPSKTKDNDVFNFSLNGLSKYYISFNRFYSAFLFIRLFDYFEDRFPKSQKMENSITLIRNFISDENQRCPEIVTFEEMNVNFEDEVHFDQFKKNPAAITLLKGMPRYCKSVIKKNDNQE